MKPIGNIAKHLDFSKPVKREHVKKAIARMKAEQRGLSLKDAQRAGYEIQWLHANPIAIACAHITGRLDRSIPHLVKSH